MQLQPPRRRLLTAQRVPNVCPMCYVTRTSAHSHIGLSRVWVYDRRNEWTKGGGEISLAKRSINDGDKWKPMISAFDDYVRRTGSGLVPANYPDNPQLGRWVAMIRYRHKLGEFDSALVAELDQKGFVWSPSEQLWNAMFRELLTFRAKAGHCEVPADWPDSRRLASWVSNQRHQHKLGHLNAERVRQLTDIGFRWNVYGNKDVSPPKQEHTEKRPTPQVDKVPKPQREERLYHIGADGYVQYGDTGELPDKLRRYLARHSDWPPYIPLPAVRTRYVLGGYGGAKPRRIEWKGRGPLHAEIMAHVNENGCLPPQA